MGSVHHSYNPADVTDGTVSKHRIDLARDINHFETGCLKALVIISNLFIRTSKVSLTVT